MVIAALSHKLGWLESEMDTKLARWPVGPEFSSQLIMLKESICKIIICRHEAGYFFRDLLSTAAESPSTVYLDLN